MASNLFGMMNTSTTGLMTSQAAISVTGNNISNANTEGYTRQRALITSNTSIYYRGTGYLGTGVNIKDIQRIRDSHLDAQIRNETSELKQHEATLEVLNGLEIIFNEPSEIGLNASMGQFWSAWEELSKHPENSTMHTLVKEESKELATQLNQLSESLKESMANIESRQEFQAGQASELIIQLNEINQAIKDAHDQDPTRTANDLLDQRDRLTLQLSEMFPVTVTENANGTIEVSTTLEDGTSLNVLEMDKDDILDHVGDFTSGSLRGYEDVKQSIEDKYLTDLNAYTEAFVEAINDAQGFEFFQYDAADPTGTLKVNPDLLNGTLQIQTGLAGDGDNTTVLKTLQVRNEQLTINGKKTTLDNYYKTLIGDLGTNTQHAQSKVQNQNTMLGYLQNQYESVSGVSLDEEVVNLVQFQKAYDANAKVISTIAEMLDTIINKLGV